MNIWLTRLDPNPMLKIGWLVDGFSSPKMFRKNRPKSDYDYAYGIALYVVEKDFCKKWFCISFKLVLGKDKNKFIDLNAVFLKNLKFKNVFKIKSWKNQVHLKKWA